MDNYLNLTGQEIKDILDEYAYDPDIFNNEDERTLSIKKAMTKLAPADKIMFCLYLEIGSSRKLGEFLGGISHSTILREISRIKEIILNEIE